MPTITVRAASEDAKMCFQTHTFVSFQDMNGMGKPL